MISMRRSLLIMLALILLITQLASALWLWHESREQISFLVNETLSASARRTCRKRDPRSDCITAGSFPRHDVFYAYFVRYRHQLDYPPA